MPRLFPSIVLLAALALIAATAPPSPTPAPVPPSASFSQTPVVMIYPFDVQSGMDPKIGIAIAEILSQEMTQAGGIAVLPVPQKVARTDFLTNAQKQHADFYISGYLTPIGNSASVVTQVVTVDSGVILFSQTAQVFSVADVASQALQERSQILAFVNRGTENIASQSSNTPAPSSTNGTQMKIGGIGSIVDSVFGHHRSGSTPAPSSSTTKPGRGVIVAPVTAAGVLKPADISNATNELYFALAKHYNAAITGIKSDVKSSADSICGPNRDNTIATGTLAENVPKHRGEIDFTLQVYTCFGAILDTEVGKGPTVKNAVDAAVTAYASAHPENNG